MAQAWEGVGPVEPAAPHEEKKRVSIESPAGEHDSPKSFYKRGRKDSFRQLSAQHSNDHLDDHKAKTLPVCLVIFVALLALLLGFLVAGVHKSFVYAGCPLGINGCNSFSGYSYEKKSFKLMKAMPDLPEEAIYVVTGMLGAFICGQIIAWSPEEYATQLLGGGTAQSLVAVATGETIRLRAALLRFIVSTIFLGSGGSLGGEGPAIQVATAVAMKVGWVCGIRAAVTQSLLASLGFSCGFAGSFNAPVTGILFAMEELQHVSTRLTQSTIFMVLVASVMATSVSRLLSENSTLFHANWTAEIVEGGAGGSINQVMGHNMWQLIAIPIGIVCSIAGYWINRSQIALRNLVLKWEEVVPLSVQFMISAAVTAGTGAIVFRFTGLRGVWGIGASSLQDVFDHNVQEDFGFNHFLMFAVGKALALVVGVAVRAPGDMLEPVLLSGAFLGGAIGSMMPKDPALAGGDAITPCVIFGMVGLFAACFRFPLTPIVIVLEITGIESYTIIIPAALCCFTSVTCSNHMFHPLLESVLEQDGIDLEELAEEAEDSYQAQEQMREDGEEEAMDSEENNSQPSEAAAAAGLGRSRSNSIHSHSSFSRIAVALELESSLVAQSRQSSKSISSKDRAERARERNDRNEPNSSPAHSRRPSHASHHSGNIANIDHRKPSLASSHHSAEGHFRSNSPSRRPSESQEDSHLAPPPPAPASSLRRRTSINVAASTAAPMIEVPMQGLPFPGRAGGQVYLRFAVQQVGDPKAAEPSFVLQVQQPGSPLAPPMLQPETDSPKFGSKGPSGFSLADLSGSDLPGQLNPASEAGGSRALAPLTESAEDARVEASSTSSSEDHNADAQHSAEPELQDVSQGPQAIITLDGSQQQDAGTGACEHVD